MTVMAPEQQFRMPNPAMTSTPQFTITTSGPPMEMPMQYAQTGLPIVDAQGHMQIAMPSQLQFVQQKISHSQVQPAAHQPDQTPSPPQNTFASFPAEPQPMQVTAQLPKHTQHAASEFFVHEYTPPQEIKRTTTPRKTIDTGPKNYTFANQGPEHFERGKKGGDAIAKVATSSSSPASAASF